MLSGPTTFWLCLTRKNCQICVSKIQYNTKSLRYHIYGEKKKQLSEVSLGQQRRSHWPWRRPPLVSSGSALSNTVVARCYSHEGFLLIESCPQREAATATRDQRWRCSTGEAPSAAERSRPSSSDPVNSHTFQTVALGRNFLSKQRSWSRMFLKCLPLPGGAVWSVPSKSVFTWGLHFHNHTFFFFTLFPTASV